MSKEIDQSKSRISRADAYYLLQRPWLTTSERRSQLIKMVNEPPKRAKAEPEPTPASSDEE